MTVPRASRPFPSTTLFRSGQIARPDLPATKTWSRLEAAALGLRFPAYNDDLALIALSENKYGVTRRINPKYQSPYAIDRKSTRLNSSHRCISYAVFCLKKK